MRFAIYPLLALTVVGFSGCSQHHGHSTVFHRVSGQGIFALSPAQVESRQPAEDSHDPMAGEWDFHREIDLSVSHLIRDPEAQQTNYAMPVAEVDVEAGGHLDLSSRKISENQWRSATAPELAPRNGPVDATVSPPAKRVAGNGTATDQLDPNPSHKPQDVVRISKSDSHLDRADGRAIWEQLSATNRDQASRDQGHFVSQRAVPIVNPIVPQQPFESTQVVAVSLEPDSNETTLGDAVSTIGPVDRDWSAAKSTSPLIPMPTKSPRWNGSLSDARFAQKRISHQEVVPQLDLFTQDQDMGSYGIPSLTPTVKVAMLPNTDFHKEKPTQTVATTVQTEIPLDSHVTGIPSKNSIPTAPTLHAISDAQVGDLPKPILNTELLTDSQRLTTTHFIAPSESKLPLKTNLGDGTFPESVVSREVTVPKPVAAVAARSPQVVVPRNSNRVDEGNKRIVLHAWTVPDSDPNRAWFAGQPGQKVSIPTLIAVAPMRQPANKPSLARIEASPKGIVAHSISSQEERANGEKVESSNDSDQPSKTLDR